MLSAEEGASEIVNEAIDKYENHFEQIFPFYEYIHITKDEDYDISIHGAKKLFEFIDGCILKDTPVPIPDGYEERMY